MNSIVQFIQSFLLGDGIMFLALLIMFAGLTVWALNSLKERTGYVVGWMIGLLFIIGYSSVVGVAAAPEGTPPGSLGILDVLLPGSCGLIFGVIAVAILRVTGGGSARLQDFFRIAAFTALGVILIFLMIVSPSTTRRVIGIFTLGFAITAIITMVVLRRLVESQSSLLPSRFRSQAAVPPQDFPEGEALDENAPRSRLDAIRDRFRTDSNIDGRPHRHQR